MSEITKVSGVVTTAHSIVLVLTRSGDSSDSVVQIPRDDFRFDDLNVLVRGRFASDGQLAKLSELLDRDAPVRELAGTPAAGKAVEAARAGQDPAVVRLFHDRLAANPGASARASLYHHVQESGITLATDGSPVMYKRVRRLEDGRLVSAHDGAFEYRVGEWATVDRSKCGDTPDTACGFGLHVCPWSYLDIWSGFGTVVLELLCPPEDFTSVPPREHKLRTCRVFVRRIVPDGEEPVAAVVEAPRTDRRRARRPKSSRVRSHRAVIPQILCQEAGWQAGAKLRAVVADPRSRAVLVTSLTDAQLKAVGALAPTRDHPHYEEPMSVAAARFTATVSSTILATALIGSGTAYAGGDFTMVRSAAGLVEIRRARRMGPVMGTLTV